VFLPNIFGFVFQFFLNLSGYEVDSVSKGDERLYNAANLFAKISVTVIFAT